MKSTPSSEPSAHSAQQLNPLEDEAVSQSLRSLRRGLQRANRFSLFIAVCNSPALRDKLIESLRESMPDQLLKVVSLAASAAHPLETALDAVRDEEGAPDAIMLIDLEKAIRSEHEANPTIAALNLSRTRWSNEITRPVVLWVPEYLYSLLARKAPDFMDYRSDVIFFRDGPTVPNPLLPLESRFWSGGTDGQMPANQRRERIAELKSRLKPLENTENRHALSACSTWSSELGNHFYLLGDVNDAEAMYQKALRIDEQLGHLKGMARDYGNLGNIMQTRGNLDGAREFWMKARDLFAQLGAQHMVDKVERLLQTLPQSG